MKKIYLASPYTHQERTVMDTRCAAVQKVAAKLMLAGNSVFSPIAHSHGIAVSLPEQLLRNHDFWLRQDLPFLACCDELVVLCLAGWEASVGVQAEIAFATGRGIPVRYLKQLP